MAITLLALLSALASLCLIFSAASSRPRSSCSPSSMSLPFPLSPSANHFLLPVVWSVVCGLLSVICCLLFVVCCMPSVVCCLRLLSVVCCLHLMSSLNCFLPLYVGTRPNDTLTILTSSGKISCLLFGVCFLYYACASPLQLPPSFQFLPPLLCLLFRHFSGGYIMKTPSLQLIHPETLLV